MNISMNPRFVLNKNGDKEFALLPFEEFEKMCELLEDYKDLMDLREAVENSNGESLTFDEIKKKYDYPN